MRDKISLRFESTVLVVLFAMVWFPATAADCRGVWSKMCAPDPSSKSSQTGANGDYSFGNFFRNIGKLLGDDPDDRRETTARATRVNNEGVQLQKIGDWDGALGKYQEAARLNPNSKIIQENLLAAQEVVANRAKEMLALRDAEQQRANMQAGLSRMAAILDSPQANRTSELAFDSGSTSDRPAGGGLDFMSATPLQGQTTIVPNATPNADPNLVDARNIPSGLPPNLPRLEAVENSPGREAWLRGMDALIKRDWQLSLAWFKTAQQRDPTNTALSQAVVLVEWRINPQPVAPPPIKSQQAQSPRLPPPEARTIDPRLEVTATDRELWAPEMKKMVTEMHASLTSKEQASLVPNAPVKEVMRTGRRVVADELAGQAITRINAGDYAGAVELLDAADRQAPEIPNFRNTRDLVRTWITEQNAKPRPHPAVANNQPVN